MACRIQNQLLVFLCTALIFSCSGHTSPARVHRGTLDSLFDDMKSVAGWFSPNKDSVMTNRSLAINTTEVNLAMGRRPQVSSTHFWLGDLDLSTNGVVEEVHSCDVIIDTGGKWRQDLREWWMVDLGDTYHISRVEIHSSGSECDRGKVNIREFGIKASIDGKGNVTNWETKFTQDTEVNRLSPMEVIYFKKLRARFIAIYTHPVSILSFLYLREVKVIQAEIPSGTHECAGEAMTQYELSIGEQTVSVEMGNGTSTLRLPEGVYSYTTVHSGTVCNYTIMVTGHHKAYSFDPSIRKTLITTLVTTLIVSLVLFLLTVIWISILLVRRKNLRKLHQAARNAYQTPRDQRPLINSEEELLGSHGDDSSEEEVDTTST